MKAQNYIQANIDEICAIQLYAYNVLDSSDMEELKNYCEVDLKCDCQKCPINTRCLLFTDRIASEVFGA